MLLGRLWLCLVRTSLNTEYEKNSLIVLIRHHQLPKDSLEECRYDYKALHWASAFLFFVERFFDGLSFSLSSLERCLRFHESTCIWPFLSLLSHRSPLLSPLFQISVVHIELSFCQFDPVTGADCQIVTRVRISRTVPICDGLTNLTAFGSQPAVLPSAGQWRSRNLRSSILTFLLLVAVPMSQSPTSKIVWIKLCQITYEVPSGWPLYIASGRCKGITLRYIWVYVFRNGCSERVW